VLLWYYVLGEALSIRLLVFFLLFTTVLKAEEKSYDVVIAGAGSGGVAAAIQASRMGARVALVEETDWIGGQMTAAAVSTMDEGGDITQNSGFYGEFLEAMKAEYGRLGKSVGTCYYSAKSHCFEPSVIQRVLYKMIEDTRSQHHVLDIYLHHRVVKVLSDGTMVTGIETEPQMTVHSSVLIDATEFGDVLPLTPAAYRISHFTSDDSVDPKACVQSLTYVGVIRKYPNGVPAELQLKDPPPGYSDALRDKFSHVMTRDGNPETKVPPVDLAMHNLYRGLPDSSNPSNYDAATPQKITRSELNWFNDYPMHAGDFSGSQRTDEICAAKIRTLQVLYYIQHDMGETAWSVADDEGYNTPYNQEHACANIPEEFRAIEQDLPPLPYIRESRRLVGVYTLTASDIRREGDSKKAAKSFPTAIAVGDYADDLHGCNQEADLEHDLEHVDDRPPGFREGPFQVPMEALIPIKVDGLLAAEKNISQSRTANGATRLQPITMLTGQAAGTLAALSVLQHKQPRQVDPAAVQYQLLRAGAVLAMEEDSDLQHGTELWQAAQFVVAHGWMSASDGKFQPSLPLTRGESAELLAEAYSVAKPFNEFRPAIVNKATFSDVPLWSRYSAPVERLMTLHAADACPSMPQIFCPSKPASASSFLQFATRLSTRRESAAVGAVKNVNAQTGDVLTRGAAALILYRLATAGMSNLDLKARNSDTQDKVQQ